jgi:twinkle protein
LIVVLNDDKVEARYPYYKDGKHVANKIRYKGKKFSWEYVDKEQCNTAELFGQHLFTPGQKAITVVEGEYDAPAAWTLLGSRFPVVSVSSCGTALRDVKNNFEYLNSFEKIVLCLDGDDVGQKTAKSIADLFAPGKCRILTLQEAKDPNAYLAVICQHNSPASGGKPRRTCQTDLKSERRCGMKSSTDRSTSKWITPLLASTDLRTDLRLSEMVVVTAETGIGKTSILKEIEYALLMHLELKEKNYGVGFIHLEEPNYDTALGLHSHS